MDIKDFKDLATKAHNVMLAEEKTKEAEKVGVLRGGSAGALVGDKAYYSQCGRLAQARFLGKQAPVTQSMRAMFNGGFSLERSVKEILTKGDLPFTEEPSYVVDHPEVGKIGMRPDFEILLKSPNGAWEGRLGIEVKSLASPFSVIKQQKNGFPFMKHLIQSASYMTFLERDKWVIVIGRSFNTNQNGKKIDSGMSWYSLSLVENKFVVENENGETMTLPFDKSHIIAYYKEVKAATVAKRLMPRPTEKELKVDTYDRCKYCPMQNQCNKFDNGQIDFDEWLANVETNKEKDQG